MLEEVRVCESKKTRLGCKTIKCKSGKGKSTRLRCKKGIYWRGGGLGNKKTRLGCKKTIKCKRGKGKGQV